MILSTMQISPREVARHYDELDPYYRDIWGESLHHGLWKRNTDSREKAVINLTREVAKRAMIKHGQRVLDVGCGYGAPAARIAEERNVHVTGLTLSTRQLLTAKDRDPRRGSLEFHLQDFLDNDFRDSTYDAVIAIESTEHMNAKLNFFEEAYRILKPGGRLVVCFWSTCEKPSPLSRKFLLEPICSEGRMPSLISFGEAKHLAKHAGFESTRISDLSNQVSKTWTESLTRTLSHFAKNPRQIPNLSSKNLPSADFAKSLARIMIAYRVGSLRYGLLSARKNASKPRSRKNAKGAMSSIH